jgi:serine/threonine protein kinase, bacterial
MTIVHERRADPERLEDEALFKEARRRRRRRWIVGIGITILVTVVATVVPLVTRDHAGQAGPLRYPHQNSSPHTPVPPAPSSPGTSVLQGPGALAVTSDGGVLIAEQTSNRIVKREPSGRLEVIAGNGHAGFSGDGGPATEASLNGPASLAVSPSGTIYVADLGNDRIRSIAPTGTITTVAKAEQPVAVALGPNGAVYVVDQAGVQTVGPDGTLKTLIPSAFGPAQDPTIDGSQFALDPDAIAVSSTGDVYVADLSPKVVIRYPTVGPPSLVGDPSQSSVRSGGIYVTRAGLASGPDGTVVVGDYEFSIDRVTGSGVSVITSFARRSVPGLDGAFRPSGVAVAPNGEIYAATDGTNGGTNASALISIDPDGEVHLLDKG